MRYHRHGDTFEDSKFEDEKRKRKAWNAQELDGFAAWEREPLEAF